ncbi:hypothetical protein NtRootA1_07790 [Arthrobacter sp. NtRootA1]|nr:hypothetical protein NtRootA1_07790 [Arthrobacter sp. NtRootA1]
MPGTPSKLGPSQSLQHWEFKHQGAPRCLKHRASAPGFWRAGWMLVLRVIFFRVIVAFCFLGGGTFEIKDRLIPVDALATGL